MDRMDEMDRRILRALQKEVPICERPYAVIADQVGDITEEEVMERVRRMKEEGLIRRMTGFFNSDQLEYASTLCGMVVPEDHIEALSDIIKQIPGITHNYLRDHRYNMWFTLIARDEEEVEAVVRKISDTGLAKEILRLPTKRKFKIHLSLDPGR